ncbi:PAS domain S-box protein [Halomicrococcus sp. SG-WS-1]|uniref:PAS domain S-box protein n=1 Tax=Halomicrococcus sp. SG-WS-1 TaxID=3439057 RepID=UPI003F79079C
MKAESQVLSRVDGWRVIVALGGLYLTLAAGWPFTPLVGERTLNEVLMISVLTAVPGLVLLYSGYRLPGSDIRPDLFATIVRWCLGSIGVMLGVLLFIEFAAELNDPIANLFILTAFASVAGLGMGTHDARARTRALNAEERRREAERYSQELERYETIVETVNDGIYVVDENDRFKLVNEAYAEMVGYDRDELIGAHASLVVEGDVDRLADEIHRDVAAGDGETDTYEGTLETASGETIEVEATVAGLPDQGDAGHDFVGVVRDVTERNERELRLERQNERLDSFASMVAHELRNPVMIGQMYCHELPADAAPEAVDHVTESFDRIEDMIEAMLVVTQGSEAVSESTSVPLADAARSAWEKVDAPDATLEVLVDGTIRADETYVAHLFRNLFENAVDHGGADVAITVGELPTGFYVEDDGPGIPADDRETVFEVGYTTEASHGGMGLGLAFVDELAGVYEWTCAVTDSDVGGARFEFTNVRDS